jgi:hypothetical protein
MKKCFFTTLIAMFLLTAAMQGQNLLISVQNGDSVKFFTNLQTAIDSAAPGSTIVLPAQVGDYQLNGDFTINKKLFIYGVGHYPDSTTATGRTVINGTIYILSGADSGSISGLYINGSIKFGTNSTNQSVNYYNIYQNRMNYLYLASSSDTNLNNHRMVNNNLIINDIDGYNIQNCAIRKNLIGGTLQNLNNSYLNNNIFLRAAYYYWNWGNYISITLNNINNCLFENNIFLNFDSDNTYNISYFLYNCNYNTFNHNIFQSANPLPYGTNVGSGNISGQTSDTTFVNQTGHIFDYSHNYHLKSISPGKNAGTDSTDIGIYGTTNPYKEGAVPIIPHIKYRSITPTEVTNGKLLINVKVEAQTK